MEEDMEEPLELSHVGSRLVHKQHTVKIDTKKGELEVLVTPYEDKSSLPFRELGGRTRVLLTDRSTRKSILYSAWHDTYEEALMEAFIRLHRIWA